MNLETFRRNWALHYIRPEYLYLPDKNKRRKGITLPFFSNGVYRCKDDDTYIKTAVVQSRRDILIDEYIPHEQFTRFSPYNGYHEVSQTTPIFEKKKQINGKHYTFQVIPSTAEITSLSVSTCYRLVGSGVLSDAKKEVIYPEYKLTYIIRVICNEDKYIVNFKYFGDYVFGDAPCRLSTALPGSTQSNLVYYMDLGGTDEYCIFPCKLTHYPISIENIEASLNQYTWLLSYTIKSYEIQREYNANNLSGYEEYFYNNSYNQSIILPCYTGTTTIATTTNCRFSSIQDLEGNTTSYTKALNSIGGIGYCYSLIANILEE